MAFPNDTLWQRKTVPATGTGSFYFMDMATPYVALQTLPVLSTTDITYVALYESNVSPRCHDPSIPGDANTPVTSSQHAYVWVQNTAFSGTVTPASAFITSSLYDLSQVASKHIRLDVGSIVGGDVTVYINRKG